MAPAVSFVIPVLNEAAVVADQLDELRRRFPAAEIIVVDGGSEDGTVPAALRRCDQVLIGSPGRAAQMNLGADVAAGDYLCFLHADTRPLFDAAVFDAVLAQGPAWGFCRVRLTGRGPRFRVIEWFMNRRSQATAVATGDQMLFVERGLFARSGGFDNIPLMEDVACCKRLRRVAAPVVVAEGVLTSSRRWEEGGALRTVLRMWCLRLAYFIGVSPDRLWRHYYGR